MPETPSSNEEDKLLMPSDQKPTQIQAAETKHTGMVNSRVFLRYIQASVCGFIGLIIIFSLFATSSAINLLVNWWLGRWANAERIRYGSESTDSRCTVDEQIFISNMTVETWHKTQDHYFFRLLREYY